MSEEFKNTPTVCVVLRGIDDGLVMIQRGKEGDPGFGQLALPGGYQNGNSGESLRDAACREFKEETGFSLLPQDLRLLDVANATNGTNLIFWEATPIAKMTDKLEAHFMFFRTEEVSKLVLVKQPVTTAFPLHDYQVRRFFARRERMWV